MLRKANGQGVSDAQQTHTRNHQDAKKPTSAPGYFLQAGASSLRWSSKNSGIINMMKCKPLLYHVW